MTPACSTCDYCVSRPLTKTRECRVSAPVLLINPSTSTLYSGWPEVDPDDWCAQYAPKAYDATKDQVD